MIEKIPFSKAQEIAHKIAQGVAHRLEDVDDLTQEALMAYHIAKVKEVDDPISFAHVVMRRAAWRFYTNQSARVFDHCFSLDGRVRSSGHWTNKVPRSPYDAGETALLPPLRRGRKPIVGRVPADEQQHDLREYLEALEKVLGKRSKMIAENLINATDQTYCALLIHRTRRRNRGHLSQVLLAKAMKTSTSVLWEHIQKIKAFTKHWMEA